MKLCKHINHDESMDFNCLPSEVKCKGQCRKWYLGNTAGSGSVCPYGRHCCACPSPSEHDKCASLSDLAHV